MIALTLSTVNLTAKSKGCKYIFSRSVTSLSLSELDSPQKLWTTWKTQKSNHCQQKKTSIAAHLSAS